MFASPKKIYTESVKDKVSEQDLLWYYFGFVTNKVYNSPFRSDSSPSFGVYERNGRVYFKDFATNDRGGIYDMLKQKFSMSYKEVMCKIEKDFSLEANRMIAAKPTRKSSGKGCEIKVRLRKWSEVDTVYWKLYGITKEFLQQFDIYPIDYYWIDDSCFKADKIAYTYVEYVDGKPYFKVYQPFSKYKWCNNYPTGTLSLIDKIPINTDKLIICSSVKDALCLWCNTGIPCISPQGEGYDVDIEKLHERFKKADLSVFFDNDKQGIEFAKKLSNKYGIDNLILTSFHGGKDISDYYVAFGNLNLILQQWILPQQLN